ncbi:MAG: threonine dehydratase [Actinomycetota bacterium]|jgi:threonine dehydratase|nr:threonine dehydratase [Actinomycetota bacterium]
MFDSLVMPTFDGVRAAAERIAPYGVSNTPLYRWPGLDRVVGTEVWVKHENHQPVGAFKVRGGVNLISQLDEATKSAGVIAASTGNHGQSIAFASKLFGVPAKICVPENANAVKVGSMRDLGAEVIAHGRDFDDAREHSEELADRYGYRYVHSGNEPLLIEGVGTITLEILEERPDIDVVIVPIGGGSGAAGACVAGKAIKPGLRVIGVQAAAAPAAFRSWEAKSLLEDEMKTAAEGLATRTAFEMPQQIMWDQLDEFVLVSEDELSDAVVMMIEHTRNLVELAGAASLAAALKLRADLEGKKVALICSGGNITVDQLRMMLL